MTFLRNEKLIVPSFVLALLVLLLIGLSAYRQSGENAQAVQKVHHSFEVLGGLDVVLSLTQQAVMDSRGYVITGQDSYLEPFNDATAKIDSAIQNLRRLTTDNPEQQRRLHALELVIARRIEIAQAVIALRKTQGQAAAEHAVSTGEGMRVSNEIRRGIAQMQAAENQLLQRRTEELRASNARTLGYFIVLVVLLAGLLMAVLFLVRRNAAAAQREIELTEEARAYALNIVDTVREPLLVLDAELRVQSANRSFYQTFRVTPQETEGNPLYELGNGQWDLPELRRLLREILPQHTSFQDFEVELDFPGIGRRAMLLNARTLFRAGNNTGTILLAIDDVTERKRREEALKQQASLLDLTYDAILVWEWGKPIVFWNRGAEYLYGYPRGEAIGQVSHDLLRTARPGGAGAATFLRELERNDRWEGELEHTTRDGRRVTVSSRMVLIRQKDRTLVLETNRDITERRRAEEERDLLFTLSRDMICVAGFDGYFKSLNPAWEKALGFTPEELLAAPFLDFVHPEDRQTTAAEAAKLATGMETVSFENRYRCKDGSSKWFLWNATPSVGRQLIYAVAHEITERKQAEAALHKSHQELQNRFEVAVRASGHLLYERDAKSNAVSYGNVEALGYTQEEMGNGLAHWVELVHPEDREAFHQEAGRSVQAKSPFHLEYRVRRKDGEYIYAEDLGYHTLGEDGNVRNTIGFVADISERKKLEEQFRQAQKMEAVGRLAGGIAHDFNNLLGVIIGFSDLLGDRIKGDEGALKYVAQIRKAGDSAARLTRQLLAFSRKQVLEPRVLDLNGIISDQGKMLHRLIGEDIKLVTVAAPDLGQVKVDPGQIEQVILNLAVNARDAMPKGGKLTIETANVELDESYARAHIAVVPGRYVMLAVSDTGVGMDANTRVHLFEPFFTTKKQGTGLGLATVYGIVKQSGGNIWMYSELGKGTTFKIYLPRVDAKTEVTRVQASPEAVPGGSETVLLVEDSESLRNVAREFLERSGYTVLEPLDGSEALRMAEQRKTPIHLLLTDVVMPGMSGRDVAEQVRRHHPEAKVLYMSGYTDDAIVQHGVLEEGVSLLSKPFTGESLARKVRQVLDS